MAGRGIKQAERVGRQREGDGWQTEEVGNWKGRHRHAGGRGGSWTEEANRVRDGERGDVGRDTE